MPRGQIRALTRPIVDCTFDTGRRSSTHRQLCAALARPFHRRRRPQRRPPPTTEHIRSAARSAPCRAELHWGGTSRAGPSHSPRPPAARARRALLPPGGRRPGAGAARRVAGDSSSVFEDYVVRTAASVAVADAADGPLPATAPSLVSLAMHVARRDSAGATRSLTLEWARNVLQGCVRTRSTPETLVHVRPQVRLRS